MAPVPTKDIAHLAKRIYYHSYNNRRSTYRPWWVVFVVLVPLILFLLFCCSFRKRNMKRRAQGQQYVPYTGWTAYQWNNNNAQQQQQPYYKPEYDYNNQPVQGGADYNNQGYNQGGYNQGGYNQPPNYQQTTGENVQYDRPEGPPPGQQPSYPQDAHTKY